MAFVGALAPVLGVLGAGISAVGAIEQGQAAKSQADYQAAVANNNAIIAQQNAVYAEQAGAAQTEQEGLKNAETAGAIKAGLAANNVDTNTGSAADVIASQRLTGQLDTATTNQNALLQAYGYRTQATNYQAQAGLYQAEADQAPIGAAFNAAGGLLGNASAIGFKWNTSPFTGSTIDTPSTSYPTTAAPVSPAYGGS